LLSGRALSQTNKVPFYLWKSIFYNLFDIKEDDEAGTVKVKLTYRLKELLGDDREPSDFTTILDSFAILWGLPKEDTGADTEEYDLDASFERIFSLIKGWANRNSVIMIIDDLQWADTASVELITKILEDSKAPFPLMIIGGARLEFLQTHKNLLQRSTFHVLKEIALNSSSIKNAYPDLRNYPEWVLDKIAIRSEGNPYFMEELTKSILTSYSLEDLEELTQSKGRRLTFPRSLRISLQARIDSLTPESRGVLLVASVIGRTFWRGAVITAANTPIDTTRSLKVTTVDFIKKIDESFKELIRKELVFPKIGSYFSNETQYIFKHALLREVAYDLLPKKFRRQCHIAVANWLIERAGPDFYYTIGEHYEKGNDIKNARTYYGLAAVRAQSRGAAEEYDSIMEKIQGVLTSD
jgi:predicted ATPase